MDQTHKQHSDGKTSNEIAVEIYCDFDGIQYLQKEWDTFVESCCSDIFQTFDWCRIWWKYYGKDRKLHIMIFRKEGRIVGIVPLFADKVSVFPCTMTILKYVGSDYTLCQFSPAIHKPLFQDMMQAFIQKVSEFHFDLIHFGPIAGRFDAIEQIAAVMQTDDPGRYTTKVMGNGYQTYFKLADTWDKYLASLSKKQRYNIKRQYKQIEDQNDKEDEKIFSDIVDQNDFDHSFEEFVKLHTAHWNTKNKQGHFADWPLSLAFHKEVAKTQLLSGRLKLIKVLLGKLTLGYEYSYFCGKLNYGLLVARNDCQERGLSGMGRIIFAEQVKHAIKGGLSHIDSMRGEYAHKSEWGGELREIKSIFIVNNKCTSKLKVAYLSLFRKILHLVYYRLLYGILFPKFRITTGGLWDLWIRTRL